VLLYLYTCDSEVTRAKRCWLEPYVAARSGRREGQENWAHSTGFGQPAGAFHREQEAQLANRAMNVTARRDRHG